MKRIVLKLVALTLAALMLCLCFASCEDDGEITDTGAGNVSESQESGGGESGGEENSGGSGNQSSANAIYTVDPLFGLVRLEYDEEGRFLGAFSLDQYIMSTQPVDCDDSRIYFYGEDGRIEKVIYEVAVFDVKYSEDGLSAEGLCKVKGAVTKLALTFDDNGRLLTEDIYMGTGESPTHYFGYKYGENGEYIGGGRGDSYEATYTREGNELTVVFGSRTDSGLAPIDTYKLTYNEDGTVAKFVDGEDEFNYTYDASGNCVAATGIKYGYAFTSAMTYGAGGRLTTAAYEIPKEYCTSRTSFAYTYNGNGDILSCKREGGDHYADGSVSSQHEALHTYVYTSNGELETVTVDEKNYSNGKISSRYVEIRNGEYSKIEYSHMSTNVGEDGFGGTIETHSYFDQSVGTGIIKKEIETFKTDDGRLIYEKEVNYEIDASVGHWSKGVEVKKKYYVDNTVVSYMAQKETVETEYAAGKPVKTTTTVEMFDESGNVTSTNTTTDSH